MTLADGRRLNDALHDGRALLLDLDPAGRLREFAAKWGKRLGYGIGATTDIAADALLIRPDGVVAWAGARDDRAALALALSRWVGDPGDQRSLDARGATDGSSRRDR